MTPDVALRRDWQLPVLMYHSIGTGIAEEFRTYQVTPGDFASQCQHLHDNGFRTVTTAELGAALLKGAGLPPKSIMFTFDDAFEDFASNAIPILSEYGFGSVVFVASGHIGTSTTWPAGDGLPLRSMTLAALQATVGTDVEIGCHSHSHIRLGELDDGALSDDLVYSRSFLAEKLSAVPVLAYPYGWVDKRVRSAAIDAGYALAMTTHHDTCTNFSDANTIPRLLVDGAADPLELVSAITTGSDLL